MKNMIGCVSALILAAMIALPAMQPQTLADGIGQKPYPPRVLAGESLLADGMGQKPYPPRITSQESLIADGMGQKPYPPRIKTNSESERA